MRKPAYNTPEPEYQGNGKVYLVGGAVRDYFLEREHTERDWVVTGATDADLVAANFRQVGQQFPVFLAPKSGEEYALARTETKSQPGHTGFICEFGPEVTLEEDLGRRDLTINAMAQSLDGELIDPHNGRADLNQKQLRHISPAFAEDPLRVLRVARFLAELSPWKFRVAAKTDGLLKAMVKSGELEDLTAERIWREVSRALASPEPGRFFEALDSWGALPVIWPDLTIPWAGSTSAKVLAAAGQGKGAEAIKRRYALVAVGSMSTEASLEEQLLLLKRQQQQLKIPTHCRRLAEQLAGLTALNEKSGTLDIAKRFHQIGLYRQPQYFRVVLRLATMMADALKRRYWDQNKLQALADAATDVDVAPLIESGLSGSKLGQALESQRFQAISKVMRSWPPNTDAG